MSRRELAREAMYKALQVRKAARIKPWEPICVFDLVEENGIEVWFVEAPSLEGMHCRKSKSKSVIFLGSERPLGRKAFTCAHEYGHNVFGHGTKIDSVEEELGRKKGFQPEEYLANSFAGFLLMPKLAVENAFSSRDWDIASPSPIEIYTIAGYFAVGYSTLVNHMAYTLRVLSRPITRELLKKQPKDIRAALLGHPRDGNLVIVDMKWKRDSIDIEVGDLILLETRSLCESACIHCVGRTPQGWLFEGRAPGIGRLESPLDEWSSLVRVSRPAFKGRNRYRHYAEEDEDYENIRYLPN